MVAAYECELCDASDGRKDVTSDDLGGGGKHRRFWHRKQDARNRRMAARNDGESQVGLGNSLTDKLKERKGKASAKGSSGSSEAVGLASNGSSEADDCGSREYHPCRCPVEIRWELRERVGA